jgi:hypothetical protein
VQGRVDAASQLAFDQVTSREGHTQRWNHDGRIDSCHACGWAGHIVSDNNTRGTSILGVLHFDGEGAGSAIDQGNIAANGAAIDQRCTGIAANTNAVIAEYNISS